MTKGLNKVQLIGRLGATPEMRYTSQGSAVTTFRIAVDRVWKDTSGEQQTETDWFRIVAWNTLAERCNQFLDTGRLVYIEGRLQIRTWEDQHNQTRHVTEIVAQEPFIRTVLRGLGVPAVDLNDVQQDVVLGAWMSSQAGRYRPDRTREPLDALKRWLFGVCRFHCTHYHERAFRRREVPVFDPWAATGEERVDPGHVGERIDAAEGLTVTCYQDADDDGYPRSTATARAECPDASRTSVGRCPAGTTNRAPSATTNDCNDASPSIRPGASETCGNGSDDDCDSFLDDLCPCVTMTGPGQNGVRVSQRSTIAPLTATVRVFPLGATTSGVQPYLGGGIGAFFWRFSETGEFIDPADDTIFLADPPFVDTGTAVGPILFGGVRFPAGDAFLVGGELRWHRAEGTLSDDFIAPKIDLGGWTGNFTMSVRF